MIVYVSLNTTEMTSVKTSFCVFRIQTFAREVPCNFFLIKPSIFEKNAIYVTEQISDSEVSYFQFLEHVVC